tara:strand:- start:33 stop:488 length:456 start_codon:yes stop_codon:yes gene_type:complete
MLKGNGKRYFLFFGLIVLILTIGFVMWLGQENSLDKREIPPLPLLPEIGLEETTVSGWITKVNTAEDFFLFRSRIDIEYKVLIKEETKFVSFAPPPTYVNHFGIYPDAQIIPIVIEDLNSNEQISIRFFSPLQSPGVIDNPLEITAFRQYE